MFTGDFLSTPSESSVGAAIFGVLLEFAVIGSRDIANKGILESLIKLRKLQESMPHPISPKVWLSENAFVSIVSASVEAFKDETLGVLLGLRELKRKRFLVQYAIVYQTAERAEDEVYPDPKRAIRLDGFLEEVTYLDVIGYFHSHPELRVEKLASSRLSDHDKRSISSGNIEIVIVVDEDHKERDWRHLSKGSLLGSVFPYSLKMSAWFKTEEDEFKISKIHCPFALGLGR